MRPFNSWRRDIECTIQVKNYTWTKMEYLARRRGLEEFSQLLCSENRVDRLQIRSYLKGLCNGK